jgi:hypothetical protein
MVLILTEFTKPLTLSQKISINRVRPSGTPSAGRFGGIPRAPCAFPNIGTHPINISLLDEARVANLAESEGC